MTQDEEFRANALLSAVQDQRDWALAEWGKSQFNLKVAQRDLQVQSTQIEELRLALGMRKQGEPVKLTVVPEGKDLTVTDPVKPPLELKTGS